MAVEGHYNQITFRQRQDAMMAAVLGDVVYWLATLIAGITIGVALYNWMYMPPDDAFRVWLLVAIGVVTWLLGRALRRALAGKR